MNSKLRWLQKIKVHLSVPEHTEVWVWWDGISVPQRELGPQRRAVGSLCFYCQVRPKCPEQRRVFLRSEAPPPWQICTRFLPLVRDAEIWRKLYDKEEAAFDAANPGMPTCNTLPAGDFAAYAARGWCRLEVRFQRPMLAGVGGGGETQVYSACIRLTFHAVSQILAALCPKRTVQGQFRRGPINVRSYVCVMS